MFGEVPGFSSFITRKNAASGFGYSLPRFGDMLGMTAATSTGRNTGRMANIFAPATADGPGDWKSWLGYLSGIVVVILAILIFVHFIITPIFKTTPGGSGFIPLPGYDTGKLYWEDDSVRLDDTKTILNGMTKNYTIAADIYIENPLAFSNRPRVLFYRGPPAVTGGSSAAGIRGAIGDYNIAMALSADTNDLLVSVLNTANNEENVLLQNVPVQQTFRVTAVVYDRALEVYVNGRLAKTRPFAYPPKEMTGPFMPPVDQIAKVRNLHMWSNILTPAEIRAAGPKMAVPEGVTAIPPVAPSCPSSA